MHFHSHGEHDHEHEHDHAHDHLGDHAPGGRAPDEQRAHERVRLAWTLGATALILVAEVVGGLLSHSLALLSDAGHMFSDVVAQGLSLAAMFLAARPADARRTYGWHRLEILAALLNGITLFVLAAGILWSGALRLRAPVEVHTGLMMVVAGVGLLANVIGAWLLHGAQSLNARSAYLHLLLDLLSSVAVMIAGAAMYFARGWFWLDPLLSMLIAVFILYSAYRLMREAVDVLLETVPRNIDLGGVSRAVGGLDGVVAVHDLHIWTITSGLYALSAHIVVAEKQAPDELLRRVNELLRRDFSIGHTTLQLESSEYDHSCHVC
jgi:cobalt-zinc-cadmium efflux system protein